MDHINVRLQVKSLDEQGRFSGLASVYGNVDLGNEVVEPGAFQKTLQDRGSEFPLLWHHDTTQPIGIARVKDMSAGLAVDGELVLETVRGRETYALLKRGAVKGLSIGYTHVKSIMQAGVKRIRELKLHEISLVPVPMNPRALVSDVKAHGKDQVKFFLETLRQCRKDFTF